MKFQQLFAAAFFSFLGLTAGCSAMHADPDHPKRNPHPVKRYEVTATTDAPGPWESVAGAVSYDVINTECTPKSDFIGVHILPQGVWQAIKLTKVDEYTWSGYFYRDLLQSEDYYGLGLCHWDGTQFAPVLEIGGVKLGVAEMVEEASKSPQTAYFKKTDVLGHKPEPYGIQNYSDADADVIHHPNAYFRVTLSVREVSP